jgi:ABC-type glutathione transport system ATPase component
MPRKTDGILFELQPRPTKGDDGKPLLYAQPVIKHKYDLDDIDDFCARYRHTSRGEMKRLFDLLGEVTTMWLSEGCRVETPFGSFAPKLKLLGDQLRKGLIGFVFQSFNLIDDLNVEENIELPLLYMRLPKAERRKRVEEAMRRMDISHRAKHFPRQLSGGQQQRVAIARAVVSRP